MRATVWLRSRRPAGRCSSAADIAPYNDTYALSSAELQCDDTLQVPWRHGTKGPRIMGLPLCVSRAADPAQGFRLSWRTRELRPACAFHGGAGPKEPLKNKLHVLH